jgi:hypothetical protein
MRHFASASLGVLLACATPVVAQAEPAVVIELFTSQGCSSCPPADEFFAMLAANPQVIALSLHVDYWDYIGWADAFARPEFTKRQKEYARAIGSRTIYTPQFIVGGQDRIEGHSPEETAKQISRHLSAPVLVDLDLTEENGSLIIRATAPGGLGKPAVVHLVRYKPSATVNIERGENAGRTVTYYNIVTSWEKLGEWQGTEPLEMTAPIAGDDPAVVILQSGGVEGILAAAKID